jgi:hypothetical protein
MLTVFNNSCPLPNNLYSEKAEKFLIEVDRLKSDGKFSDDQILIYASQSVLTCEVSDEPPK